jgi:uncharacterized protein (TIGR01777 family)
MLSRRRAPQAARFDLVNTTPSRVLVSGSSGLLGSALVSSLTTSSYQVTHLVRGSASGANQIAWNPAQPLSPESVSGFDAVVHLAGESVVGRWTAAKKTSIRDSRVQGTRNLAQALAKATQPPGVLISASAVGYYGDRGEQVLREDSPPGEGFLAGVCREWESAAEPATQAGIRTAQIRIGVVLSAAGGALQKMLPPFRLGLGGNMGSGRQWWSWIDVEDLVGAVHHIMKTESLRGPVNMVAPTPVKNSEFTKTLASVLSRPAIFPMPAFAARLAFGQMADELLLASQRVEPAQLLASGYVFQRPDLRQSLEAILKG